MIIQSIELVGFKRFALNQIQRFVLRPTERVQLILGTNGAGKSSLLRELTPLPADHKAYQKDGSKTITIAHHGNIYKLRSYFSDGNKHSFIKNNDIELNEGGTVTVQKELVWKEFGIDDQIQNLLTDGELFHQMGPSRRREWLTRLSDVSFDYAMTVYNRLKERLRDTTGALKKTKERLVMETSKIVSKEEQERLEVEIKELHIAIDNLQAVREPIKHDRNWYQNKLEEYRIQLHSGFDYIFKESATLIPQSREYESIEEVELRIDQIRHQVTATQTTINNAMQEHGKYNEQYKILQKTNGEGVESLNNKIKIIQNERMALLSARRLGLEGFDAVTAQNALRSIYDVLFAILESIPDNSDRKYNQTKYQEKQNQLLNQKEALRLLELQLAKTTSEKKLLEAHQHDSGIVCPQCHYSWNLNFSQAKYNETIEQIVELEVKIEQTKKTIGEIEENIRQYQAYVDQYMQYRGLVKNWSTLNPYWDYLETNNLVIDYPKKALDSLRHLVNDLDKEIEIAKLDSEIREIRQLIEQAQNLGDANLSEVQGMLDYYSKIVEDNTKILTKLSIDERTYTDQLRDFRNLKNRAEKTSILIEQSLTLFDESIEMQFQELIQETIRSFQIQLARKVEALQEMRLQKGIIEDLERNVEFLILEEESLKILVKEMSPTEGIIADGLLGFIRIFVSQMNQVIKKIWSYPLEVQDCGINTDVGAELDYKFPIMIETRSNIVDDVKNGSSAMQEVVNLAFKLVAMKHLGLSEYPIFLDEFSASFDTEHRVAASHAIKQIIDQTLNSQLFMISHYSASYGSFTNAQICVLDARNIVIPDNHHYNQHVTME